MADIHSIEVTAKTSDARATQLLKRLRPLTGAALTNVTVTDVYTIKKQLDDQELAAIAEMLANPVSAQAALSSGRRSLPGANFDWSVEIGFLPGVTDNVSHTARESIEDLLGVAFSDQEGVFTSQLLLLSGRLDQGAVERAAAGLANPLIQRITVRARKEWEQDAAHSIVVPVVKLAPQKKVISVDLAVPDEELADLGTYGIIDPSGQRRGPLALSLAAMKAIQTYFKTAKRQPTDIELEAIAQTWSEHCKHTIFADPLDDIENGIFKAHIKAATEKVRELKGDKDNCVSVFTDNSGAIWFDEDHLVTHKVETHNSPSALDPFGGAITGIVGVNRDTIGFGLGAKPIANVYGYCLADPADDAPLYRGENNTAPMLPPRRIMEGVIEGVNVGGNCSGIPTPQGFTYFDASYKGKPLVFAGTLGLIPAKVGEQPAHEKAARPGDLVVMVGGRVGLDGIHGATFSSVELDAHSPATAVQIGDPITQKKFSDALVKEARDRGLYTSITDNGAGGLSSSVAEMAKESGGFEIDLDAVPLKYPNLAPWQIWISESQERMTLAVDPTKLKELTALLESRGVEATVIGRFADSGRGVGRYHGDTVLDLEMEFLHEGLPKIPRTTTISQPPFKPATIKVDNWSKLSRKLIGRLNLASNEFISQQYDHEVQAGSVLKPLQGRGRVNSEVSVVAPVLGSHRGVAISQSLYPSYGELSPYAMAAAAIDTAVRNLVAVGADLDTVALLDNFCWCSSHDPFRLGQLKQATQACYDYAVAYRAPFISGKDSMFNDFKGFDAHGAPVQIPITPTLLISSIGIVSDVRQSVSLDLKAAGDLVYVLGETKDEMGGSELHDLLGIDRAHGHVPQVEAETNLILYRALAEAIQQQLVASSVSVTRGGLLAALSKTAMAGRLGLDIDLSSIVKSAGSVAAALGSESQGRVVVTVAPENQAKFETLGKNLAWMRVGYVTKPGVLKLTNGLQLILEVAIEDLLQSYRATFEEWA